MTEMTDRHPAPRTTGLLIHAAARYDPLVWLLTFGRERAFREKILSFANLKFGDAVLDVGCGTGSLAIATKRYVGLTGAVCGIDASVEMIARAEKKASKAGIEVIFKTGAAQALPFPDAQFDAVLSTLMLHHLPSKGREQCAREMRRVLKPSGRALVVDFGGSGNRERGLLAQFHRHGHVKLSDIVALLDEAGLTILDSGAVGFRDVQFARASAPG
jgi:ubiquinone/menaquinone biosynthesis C-methylase UbiE